MSEPTVSPLPHRRPYSILTLTRTELLMGSVATPAPQLTEKDFDINLDLLHRADLVVFKDDDGTEYVYKDAFGERRVEKKGIKILGEKYLLKPDLGDPQTRARYTTQQRAEMQPIIGQWVLIHGDAGESTDNQERIYAVEAQGGWRGNVWASDLHPYQQAVNEKVAARLGQGIMEASGKEGRARAMSAGFAAKYGPAAKEPMGLEAGTGQKILDALGTRAAKDKASTAMFNLSPEFCMRMADLEGDSTVGAGVPTAFPVPERCPTCDRPHLIRDTGDLGKRAVDDFLGEYCIGLMRGGIGKGMSFNAWMLMAKGFKSIGRGRWKRLPDGKRQHIVEITLREGSLALDTEAVYLDNDSKTRWIVSNWNEHMVWMQMRDSTGGEWGGGGDSFVKAFTMEEPWVTRGEDPPPADQPAWDPTKKIDHAAFFIRKKDGVTAMLEMIDPTTNRIKVLFESPIKAFGIYTQQEFLDQFEPKKA